LASPASFKNHPIHPILIVYPLGLWTFSFVCDLIRIFISPAETWVTVALYCIGGGVVGATLAAIPGFIDYLSIKDPQIKRIATNHLILNVIALLLFATNFFLRITDPTGYLQSFYQPLG
jgi:uncharacterized membrane protein